MLIEQQLRVEALRIAAVIVLEAVDIIEEAERIYQWLLNGKATQTQESA
jgi:hypothetical protein